MDKETVNLKINMQTFISSDLESKLNGFILNYNGVNYIVSVHHFLPIRSVYDLDTNNELPILINSCWSEILILDSTNIDISKYKITEKIQNKFPKIDEHIFIKTNHKRYDLKVVGYESIPFDNIQNNITIPQIKCSILYDIENVAGLSGSPVFIKNKIVGIFSKYRPDTKTIYVIPIYVVIKNIEKNDNNHIYSIQTENIKKINSYNVKDNEIYHPTLKINININTYFLLEGDTNNKVIIHYENKEKNKIEIEEIESSIKENLISPCDLNIVSRKDNLEFKINTRLLSLLHRYNSDNKIALKLLFILTKNKSSENWIELLNGCIKIIS